MLERGELCCQHRHSLPLPWLASASNIPPQASPTPEPRDHVMFMSRALPPFFLLTFCYGGFAHSALDDLLKSRATIAETAGSTSYEQVFVHVTLWFCGSKRGSFEKKYFCLKCLLFSGDAEVYYFADIFISALQVSYKTFDSKFKERETNLVCTHTLRNSEISFFLAAISCLDTCFKLFKLLL